MTLSKGDVLELVKDRLYPAWKKEKKRLDRIDKWLRWDHEPPFQPRQTTKEYKELQARSQSPWLSLIVTSVAQNLYVDGYRGEKDEDNADPWQWWQLNGLDARQVAIHRAALGFGHSYVTVMPGEDDFGARAPVIRGHSPRRMMAFYAEPEHDDWPMFALRIDEHNVAGSKRLIIRLYDQEDVHFLDADGSGGGMTWVSFETHGLGRCPVIRFANQLDLEGRTPGDVEPLIPIAGRIDQSTFDRLIVQRFASWVVRTATGMELPEEPDPEFETALKLRLKVEDILIGGEGVQFGSLPATALDGFIKAIESDIHTLAAVSQTPAHELLGQMANLSAEALAAARASLTAKVDERKTVFGEPWEQAFRLAAWVMKDEDSARDFSAQVRWRDTEIRSLAQAADALGKMATMLGVPVELLWEKVPGFTQQDVDRAKDLVADGDSISQLAALLQRQAAGDVA